MLLVTLTGRSFGMVSVSITPVWAKALPAEVIAAAAARNSSRAMETSPESSVDCGEYRQAPRRASVKNHSACIDLERLEKPRRRHALEDHRIGPARPVASHVPALRMEPDLLRRFTGAHEELEVGERHLC